MGTHRVILEILSLIKKKWLLLVSGGIFFSLILIIYALTSPPTYTSNSIIFPLSAGNNTTSNRSAISALITGGDIGKGFTNDNSVNIVELAQSRTIRQEVARTVIPEKQNRTIAQLVLEAYNNHRGILEKKIDLKPDDPALINWAISIFSLNLDAQITRTNSFQLRYTGRTAEIVKLVSYEFIDKISRFYIELKREKAKKDYEFATSTVDSLKIQIAGKDNRLIRMDDRTMFTNTSRLQYRVPAENVLAEKNLLQGLYTNAITSQQNAAYTLQQATPIIKVLDNPDPPYKVLKKSPLVFGFIGLFAGLFIILSLLVSPILFRYARSEFYRTLYKVPDN